MKKLIQWIEAVIAGNHMYAPMAGVDIKKSADRLFEKENSKAEEQVNVQKKKSD